ARELHARRLAIADAFGARDLRRELRVRDAKGGDQLRKIGAPDVLSVRMRLANHPPRAGEELARTAGAPRRAIGDEAARGAAGERLAEARDVGRVARRETAAALLRLGERGGERG